jgi:hypothetical protein
LGLLYLKHVSDERQLRNLDLWLAEEVLSLVFGGHKQGHFRKISFGQLRQMGLPSPLHRRRSIFAHSKCLFYLATAESDESLEGDGRQAAPRSKA